MISKETAGSFAAAVIIVFALPWDMNLPEALVMWIVIGALILEAVDLVENAIHFRERREERRRRRAFRRMMEMTTIKQG